MNTPDPEDSDVEPLPDFDSLSDEDLKSLIDRLEQEENEVSYRRRLLQGRIDILRAERTARLKGHGLGDVDVGRLTDILASRGTPEPPPAGDEPHDDAEEPDEAAEGAR